MNRQAPISRVARTKAEAKASYDSLSRWYDTLALMVTDVVREGSELIVSGRKRPLEKAFGVSFESGSAWFDGMLSRKRQLAPRLLESAGR